MAAYVLCQVPFTFKSHLSTAALHYGIDEANQQQGIRAGDWDELQGVLGRAAIERSQAASQSAQPP